MIEILAKNNDMIINKKKCTIRLLKGLNNKIDNIRNYPIKITYKYLSMTIDDDLDLLIFLILVLINK